MGVAAPIACLVVPFDAGRLTANQTRGMHWGAVARLTAVAHLAARAAYLAAGSPTWDGPVTIALTVRRARKLDPGAVIEGAKSVVDQLFRRRDLGYGLAWDDSDQFVAYAPVRQEIAACWKGREEIIVEVTARGEP